MCCIKARWDHNGQIALYLDQPFSALDDLKPIAVRKKLEFLQEIAVYQPRLNPRIEEKLCKLDLGQYRDSMTPLIIKDITALRNTMKK